VERRAIRLDSIFQNNQLTPLQKALQLKVAEQHVTLSDAQNPGLSG
jgi:hypothetical protein